jgi:DNA-binding response OmpR family regulator
MESRHVVVVEDDSDLRDAVCELLALEVEAVISFGDVDSARRAIREVPAPCAIVLNVDAAGSSAMTFLRELRSDPTLAGVPVLVTTTSASLATTTEPGVSWLLKPFHPSLLIHAVLEHSRKRGGSSGAGATVGGGPVKGERTGTTPGARTFPPIGGGTDKAAA